MTTAFAALGHASFLQGSFFFFFWASLVDVALVGWRDVRGRTHLGAEMRKLGQ